VKPEDLGKRIRQAREQKGLSQEELAAHVSRDQRAISEYENGKRRLSVTDLPTFASVLDVPLMYFFADEITTQDLNYLLLEEFNHLPSPELQQYAIELLRVFRAAVNLKSS
jgi:repressor LexA